MYLAAFMSACITVDGTQGLTAGTCPGLHTLLFAGWARRRSGTTEILAVHPNECCVLDP